MQRAIFYFFCLIFCMPLAAENPRITIGDFSSNNIEGWQQKIFSGETEYQLQQDKEKTVLRAESKATASAFYRAINVDLNKTPYLNWSWQKTADLNPGDESQKQGDDFVARIYVVKDGGLFLWKTKALNYVWSFSHKKQQSWDNPFAGDKARMIAVRDKNDPKDQWFREKRNIAEDFKQQFGKDIDEIDGIAIMTDTDNSGGQASALYGDIFFTSE